ncbi:FoF1 ATP synthase subunit gamma [soil metagenome]
MTERLADITARIGGVQQLGAVVSAMRGIAAARVQQARGQLDAVDRYAATIANAIGRALALDGVSASEMAPPPAHPALLLFCAEQGFAGDFSGRVLDAVEDALQSSDILLIGSRGVLAAAERGVAVSWTSPMPSHSPGIPKLADQIADALYRRVAAGGIYQLDAVFVEWRPGTGLQVERRRLFPFEPAAFPPLKDNNRPIVNLTPAALLTALSADYLHAQLCKAALHAFAAENEARMEAMAAARSHIERQLATLQASQRLVRQAEITAEIIELAAGETASRSVAGAGVNSADSRS